MTKLLPPKLFWCQNPFFAPQKNDVIEMKLLFEKAVAECNSINVEPDNKTWLRISSLFKQATKGDIDMQSPQDHSDIAAKAEFEAWASLKGKSVKDAQREFILLVNELKI